jgi:hypothetical protein
MMRFWLIASCSRACMPSGSRRSPDDPHVTLPNGYGARTRSVLPFEGRVIEYVEILDEYEAGGAG